MAPFDGKYMTAYLMTIVVSAFSLTIYKVFANQINAKSLTLNAKVKVKEKNGTCAIELAMFDYILVNFLEF